jgi:PAS domain S-box-containing protein
MSRVCLVLAWSRQDRTVAGFVRREVEAALGDGAVEVLLGGTALLARLAAGDVDVVIIDGRLGWTAVPGVVAGVRGRAPRACVLVLVDRPSVRAIVAALRAGAADCVPRQAGALRRALRWCLAHAGDSDVEPDPERRWREWFELAPVGLCAWSPDGQILAVNRQALAMLGCQGDELAGRTPGSVPVDPDEFAGVHREALARDGAVSREFEVGRDDGPRRWVRVTARALRNGEGRARFVLARCDDVTEDRQQRAALRAALAEREVLLREVHHRVKNNLQIISSLLNLRFQGASDPAARDLLRESQLRIKAIALVHQRLHSSASFARIDLEDYVCSLVANVRDAYAPLDPPVEVSLDVARVSVCMEYGI